MNFYGTNALSSGIGSLGATSMIPYLGGSGMFSSGVSGGAQSMLGNQVAGGCNGGYGYDNLVGASMWGEMNSMNGGLVGGAVSGAVSNFNQVNPSQMGMGGNYGQNYSGLQPVASFTSGNGQNVYNFFMNPNQANQASNSTSSANQTQSASQSGTLSQKEDGTVEYTTKSGWKISIKDGQITMTSPEGKTTKIEGDEVTKADGSTSTLNGDTNSFKLPDGTTITLGSSNGEIDSTSITEGNQQIKIDSADNTFSTQAAPQNQELGNIYRTHGSGNNWSTSSR